jgi:hypothetical protein
VPVVGTALWVIGLVLGGLAMVAYWIDGLDPPKLTKEDADVQKRVRGALEAGS